MPASACSISGTRACLLLETGGFREATWDLIAFLDADDYWQPNYLSIVCRLVANYPTCGVYATRYILEYSAGERRRARFRGMPSDFEGVLLRYFRIAAMSDPPIWTGAVCVRKQCLFAVGGFPEGVALGEDLLTWARLLSQYGCAYSMNAASVFCIGEEHYNHRCVRIPDPKDYVGTALGSLVRQAPHRRDYAEVCGILGKSTSFHLSTSRHERAST